MTVYHMHLVSDATGETVNSVARACLVQFKDIEPVEHNWTLIRTKGQVEKVLLAINEDPGPVLFTMVNSELRAALIEGCRGIGVPCISLLDPVIHTLAGHFNVEVRGQPGLQHELDAEYFERIEAMNYAMLHDDGQLSQDLNEADVILCGVSRTSKTPTCIYLANRGVKAANVPVVPGCPLPDELFAASAPLIVGLTKDPQRLLQVRRNRLRLLGQNDDATDYVDPDAIREELTFARRLFTSNDWPVIDVTRRSIEEIAASILNLYAGHHGRAAG